MDCADHLFAAVVSEGEQIVFCGHKRQQQRETVAGNELRTTEPTGNNIATNWHNIKPVERRKEPLT